MKELKFLIAALAIFNAFLMFEMADSDIKDGIYFLDVGQGDSTLFVADGMTILTDAGPTKKVSESLGKVMNKKHIDLAVITHPQLDHFNGFNYLIDEYEFGGFIINGRGSESREWKDLLDKIEGKNIPIIIVAEGDVIRKDGTEIKILAPSKSEIWSGELNDTGIVQLLNFQNFKTLLSADIGIKNETRLLGKYKEDLDIDVFKVSHHGSKYSSGEEFLKTLTPLVSVIGVGEKNRYGHPSKEMLQRAEKTGSLIFRTDLNGTVYLKADKTSLSISAEIP